MMTPAQRGLYWRAWAEAMDAIQDERGRKLSKAEADDLRYQCHEQAGAPQSSNAFRNDDLDKVLAAFWAWSQPCNLSRQGRQIDQPATRCQYCANQLLDTIHSELVKQGRDAEAAKIVQGKPRENYVLYILRRQSKDDVHLSAIDFPIPAWMALLAALTKRLQSVKRQAEKAKPAPSFTKPSAATREPWKTSRWVDSKGRAKTYNNNPF